MIRMSFYILTLVAKNGRGSTAEALFPFRPGNVQRERYESL